MTAFLGRALDEVVVEAVAFEAHGGFEAVGAGDGGQRDQSAHLTAAGDDELRERGEEVRGVGVGGECDGSGCDVAAGGRDEPFAVFCWGDVLGGCEGLEIEGPAEVWGDEKVLEDVGDEFVRPYAGGDAGYYGALGFGVAVVGQFVFVGHQFHHVAESWGCLLDDIDVLFSLLEFGVAVDASNPGLRHPLAVDVSVFDLALERVPVVELEVPDFGVVGVFKEDWLAVSSVLNYTLAFRLVNVHGYVNVLYQ